MILFGAGSSVPFGIPGMSGFTESFLKEFGESKVILKIKEGMQRSGKILGISLPFDLETLLSVLTDLSVEENIKKPISLATSSLLIYLGINLKEAREQFGQDASKNLGNLTQFIFETCLAPIKIGKKQGNYKFLNDFYGPLMTVLNKGSLSNIQDRLLRVFSTNWDLCFKMWADWENIPMHDGIEVDNQCQPVLEIERSINTAGKLHYVPLHGSLDIIRLKRLKGKGVYEEIQKITDPLDYFENKPKNMKKSYLIFPLEAIGYEQSIKSPYFEMLYHLKDSLMREGRIFIIGYSLRDPIIGSIFEEVIARRIRARHITPLSKNLENRKKEVSSSVFQLYVLTPDPQRLAENLERQNYTNLLNTFVPIKLEFPQISDSDFHVKYRDVIRNLILNLKDSKFFNINNLDPLYAELKAKYKIDISI